MAATAASDVTDGPVLSLINKRLRALRKKHNRILQMEEAIAQGKPLNKEQEDVLRSKPAVSASIDELEKLRQPLSVAIAEEISLALQRHQVSASPPFESTITEDDQETEIEQKVTDVEHQSDHENAVVEDLLNLLYFGTMFDVKTQSDFTSTILTRTHERGCCLTYDYMTDDESTDMLGEGDLDLISMLGGLVVSRPVDSSLSHKNALRRCIEHAKLWLANSDQSIDPDSNITYAGLRARLNKIMASDYFTTTPEMKAAVEVAAAAGNYASFQVSGHGSMVPVNVPVQVEGSDVEYQQQQDEDTANFQENETNDDQSSPVEEFHKSESEVENPAEVSAQTEPVISQEDVGQNHREVETKEQNYVPRRGYQNQRGGRGGGGGGRRGYSNGRGGRYGGRGGGGAYQNGRSQYYDQPGNYYPRNYAYNRGRGGRGGGGGNSYNHPGPGVQAGHDPADSQLI